MGDEPVEPVEALPPAGRSWVPRRYLAAVRWPRVSVGRAALLIITAVCTYLLLPKMTEVFEAWNRLDEVDLRWLPVILGAQLASFATIWHMQKIALPGASWFAVINSHVAGNAFNRITPLGGVTGAALQAGMLADAGVPAASASSAMATQSILGSVALGALPLCVLPLLAMTGTNAPDELLAAA
ncbi:MAG: lysylphosphatidylglycerol synthase domain-containing protein, partial [Acidimicrobiia bacterium]|nr:lysylphosphatidylglycerol synthase domain-containing protein [Acidimicrobiia bacterium]